MKYFVELEDGFTNAPVGRLCPIDATGHFFQTVNLDYACLSTWHCLLGHVVDLSSTAQQETHDLLR